MLDAPIKHFTKGRGFLKSNSYLDGTDIPMKTMSSDFAVHNMENVLGDPPAGLFSLSVQSFLGLCIRLLKILRGSDGSCAGSGWLRGR